MMRNKVVWLFALVVAMGAAVSSSKAQLILLSDSFDRVSGTPDVNGSEGGISSWGDNDNAMGGSIVQTYEAGIQPPRSGNRHMYVFDPLGGTDGEGRFRAGWAEIQHDFGADALVDSGGGVVIEFDTIISNLSPGWLGIAIGQTADETVNSGDPPNDFSQFLPVEDSVDFGVIFKGHIDEYETFEGGDDPDQFVSTGSGLWMNGLDANQERRFRIEVATDNFGGEGTAATVNIFITDQFGTNHVVTDYNFTWDADGEAYIGFSSNKDQGTPENPDREVRMDNLVISTLMDPVIPDCDFDNSGTCDGVDVDMLTAVIAAMTNDGEFDLNGDTFVDTDDLDIWLEDAGITEIVRTLLDWRCQPRRLRRWPGLYHLERQKVHRQYQLDRRQL